MNVGIFSPYLPKHYGGGEKHMLTTAEYLSQSHRVDILIPPHTEGIEGKSKRYETLFDLDLSRVEWKPSLLAARAGSALQNYRESGRYDVFFYATDGSLFFAGARKNILHVQIPFTNSQSGFINRLKLRTWNVINTNSKFTQVVIESHWRTKVDVVHYPYVNTSDIPYPPKKKQKLILAVGRFFDPGHTDVHAKRQDVLLDAFIRGCQEFGWHKHGWELHLVGAVEPAPEHENFVSLLKEKAADYPVRFSHDLTHDQLADLYDAATLFWHAAGFDIDAMKEPQKAEHFGMAIIEAMAHGGVPIVVDNGGPQEIVEEGHNGYRYANLDELVNDTNTLIGFSAAQLQPFQDAARAKAESFSKERFQKTIDLMLSQ